MAQRRFGPVLGPGVAVIEMEAGKSVQAAPFGVTGFVGVLEKGEVGTLISCYSQRDFQRKCGGRISGSLVPDAAQDFWNHGNGAGELHLLRVTDGTEEKATAYLWSRQTDLSGGEGRSNAVVKVQAKNGGRWGGKTRVLSGVISGLTETTLTTGITMKANEWTDGYVKLHGLSSKQYKIVSNTTAGVITVSSDSTMLTDLGGATGKYTLELEQVTTKELTLVVGNGENDSAALWSLRVYVDGQATLYYPNLSMDPASAFYFASMINDDTSNYEITVTDLNTGGNYQNYRRPASHYGKTLASTGISGTTLTTVPWQAYADSDESGTVAVNEASYTSAMKYRAKVKYVVLAGGTTMDVYASFNGKDDAAPVQVAAAVSITAYAHPLLPTVTLSTVSADDIYWLEYFPMTPNGLVDSVVYPHATSATYGNTKYRITANAVNTITVSQTMSVGATGDTEYMVVGPTYCANGYNGDTPDDADYTSVCFDTGLSAFNDLLSQNKGLVRLATPGIYATNVVKAGIAYAEAKNWIFRIDVDKTLTTEDGAINFINSTIGRSDFAIAAFPSFGWVSDPDKSGQLKLVSLSGAIMGREAAVAGNYGGYHKVAAGIDVTLPRVKQLDAKNLSEEVLTPQGINVIKKVKGNFIIWGGRTVAIDSAWKFINHRSQMSHYEHILQENFDWTIFQINDPTLQAQVISALRGFFLPEWRNRALRGETFDEACSIKVDNEINTDLTRAAGELWAEINLQLADTVERFIIRLSKDGVFEQAA